MTSVKLPTYEANLRRGLWVEDYISRIDAMHGLDPLRTDNSNGLNNILKGRGLMVSNRDINTSSSLIRGVCTVGVLSISQLSAAVRQELAMSVTSLSITLDTVQFAGISPTSPSHLNYQRRLEHRFRLSLSGRSLQLLSNNSSIGLSSSS